MFKIILIRILRANLLDKNCVHILSFVYKLDSLYTTQRFYTEVFYYLDLLNLSRLTAKNNILQTTFR